MRRYYWAARRWCSSIQILMLGIEEHVSARAMRRCGRSTPASSTAAA